MDYGRISHITGLSFSELQQRHESWLGRSKDGKKSPDLKLIAAFSGLAVSSVSGHINKRKGSVSAKKAKMLDELLSLLDYRPSHAAKKLRSLNKMSIGFIAPISNSPSTEYSVEILKGVKSEAHKFGYFVDIYDIGPDEESDITTRLPFLGLVDGLIVVSSSIDSESLAPLCKENIPVFQINPLREQHQQPFVGAINSETLPFAELLDHLFSEHGYRNPVLVCIPVEGHVQRKQKEDLFLKAADHYGINIDLEKNLLTLPSFSFRDGRAAWERAKEVNPNADVYICLSDIVAIPFLHSVQAEGRSAAVTGYGNFEIGECFNLTTIDQHIVQLGSNAFQQLYYAMQFVRKQNEFPEYRSTTGPASLIKRRTCACMAG